MFITPNTFKVIAQTTAQQQTNENPVGWTSVQQKEDQEPVAQTSTQQQTSKNRPSHDAYQTINTSKITKELNYTPQETFDSGIRKTVLWYLDSQDWLQHVLDGSYQREHLVSEKSIHAN